MSSLWQYCQKVDMETKGCLLVSQLQDVHLSLACCYLLTYLYPLSPTLTDCDTSAHVSHGCPTVTVSRGSQGVVSAQS